MNINQLTNQIKMKNSRTKKSDYSGFSSDIANQFILFNKEVKEHSRFTKFLFKKLKKLKSEDLKNEITISNKNNLTSIKDPFARKEKEASDAGFSLTPFLVIGGIVAYMYKDEIWNVAKNLIDSFNLFKIDNKKDHITVNDEINTEEHTTENISARYPNREEPKTILGMLAASFKFSSTNIEKIDSLSDKWKDAISLVFPGITSVGKLMNLISSSKIAIDMSNYFKKLINDNLDSPINFLDKSKNKLNYNLRSYTANTTNNNKQINSNKNVISELKNQNSSENITQQETQEDSGFFGSLANKASDLYNSTKTAVVDKYNDFKHGVNNLLGFNLFSDSPDASKIISASKNEFGNMNATVSGLASFALKFEGIREGSSIIGDWAQSVIRTRFNNGSGKSYPWCAIYTSAMLKQNGFKISNSPASAGSYYNYGNSSNTIQPGIIAVRARTGGNHVGIVLQNLEDGKFKMISGNQSNKVSITVEQSSRYTFRIPVKASSEYSLGKVTQPVNNISNLTQAPKQKVNKKPREQKVLTSGNESQSGVSGKSKTMNPKISSNSIRQAVKTSKVL